MKPILRDWLKELESQGTLKKIHKTVSPIHELAAVGKKLEPDCGALFEHVEGSDMPVLTGIVTSREAIARSMGLTYPQLMEVYRGSEQFDTMQDCGWRRPCGERAHHDRGPSRSGHAACLCAS